MPFGAKILPVFCAALLMAGTAGCASDPEISSGRSEVPVMEIPNGSRPAGQVLTLVDVEESETGACPVAEIAGERGLLVSPVGSYALAGEKTLVVGGTKVKVGQKFETGRPQSIEEGFDCGGKHWEVAYRLSSKSLTVSE